jgi:hypothetical protein
MRRRRYNNGPTHTWLMANRVIRWLAGIFLLLLLIGIIVISAITYAVRRDCQNPYEHTFSIGSYWFVLQVGSNNKGCPGP